MRIHRLHLHHLKRSRCINLRRWVNKMLLFHSEKYMISLYFIYKIIVIILESICRELILKIVGNCLGIELSNSFALWIRFLEDLRRKGEDIRRGFGLLCIYCSNKILELKCQGKVSLWSQVHHCLVIDKLEARLEKW